MSVEEKILIDRDEYDDLKRLADLYRQAEYSERAVIFALVEQRYYSDKAMIVDRSDLFKKLVELNGIIEHQERKICDLEWEVDFVEQQPQKPKQKRLLWFVLWFLASAAGSMAVRLFL